MYIIQIFPNSLIHTGMYCRPLRVEVDPGKRQTEKVLLAFLQLPESSTPGYLLLRLRSYSDCEVLLATTRFRVTAINPSFLRFTVRARQELVGATTWYWY